MKPSVVSKVLWSSSGMKRTPTCKQETGLNYSPNFIRDYFGNDIEGMIL